MVGARTVEHVKAFEDSLKINMSQEELDFIDAAIPFNPLFPMTFLYTFGGDREYSVALTPADNFQYRMAAFIDSPANQPVSNSYSYGLLRYL
jgi:hypothetical protein